MCKKELHSIKKFRSGNLGIIRLENLALVNEKLKVRIGDKEIKPISFDTYGHPIISEENFIYYKALKAIRERQGDSLTAEVRYEPNPFCIKMEVYDSVEGIRKCADVPGVTLKELKQVLQFRRQAKFSGRELNAFILYGKYLLNTDGNVYVCSYNYTTPYSAVMELSEVTNLEIHEQIHIPGENDVCAICGEKFDISDVKNFGVTEDENCRKSHRECLSNYIEAVNYQNASRIIDSVYQDTPKSEVLREFDTEERKEKVWYLYHTKHGDVAIRFKNKVIEIKWFGNFKPFNLEKLFAEEDVTKRKLTDSKIIHAWSMDDAIKYLNMVRKL